MVDVVLDEARKQKWESGMDAFVYRKDGLRLERISVSQLDDNDKDDQDAVLVKLTHYSACGSDMPYLVNPSLRPDLEGVVAGHEGGGEIVAIGENVSHLNVGDFVALESHRDEKKYDIGKDSFAAIQGFRAGVDGKIPQGTWVEYITVPSNVVIGVLPEYAKLWPLSLWEPLGNAIRVASVANQFGSKDDAAVVSGLGFQGNMIGAILKHYYRFEHISGIQRSQARRDFARSLGIFEGVYGNQELQALPPANLWIETSGDPEMIYAGLNRVRGKHDLQLSEGIASDPFANVILFGLYHGKDQSNATLNFIDGQKSLNQFVLQSQKGSYHQQAGRRVIPVHGVCGRYEEDWIKAHDVINALSKKMDLSKMYTDVGSLMNVRDILAQPGDTLIQKAQQYQAQHGKVQEPVLKVLFNGFRRSSYK
ncbi:alcohol dehydrogenase catalytic domain-containing protein [Candidatus Woesearchaeota archaeon]|nr:alcohol dehydrogenase catalytic domain-containing protein [Candidatus Woesearchaeota archaeon]